jgi:long-chain fatty acid transport protein
MSLRAGRLLAVCLALVGVTSLTSFPALATNGYFQHGFGTPYSAMAGAGVALSLNTLAPATNPAANAFVLGYDLGLAAFNPNREYTVTGNPSGYPGTFGLAPGTVESGSSVFLIPSIGANWRLGETTTLGLVIYGNGGMNTSYDAPTFYGGRTGVDLSQMFFAPTLTVAVAKNHAFGISPVLAYQRFQAEGLGAFGPFSNDAAALSNNGHDEAFGYGVRVGYLGKLAPWLSVGASYQSEIAMGAFDGYAGLFAEEGYFDVPETYTVGVALVPVERLTVALDLQQIHYGDVVSIGTPMIPNLMGARLGTDAGAGFGWRDVTAYKLGLAYAAASDLALRAGYSYARQPIPESEVLFNILAPGVVEHHVTAGASKAFGSSTDHLSVMRALAKAVEGPNPLEAPGQQRIELKMDEWSFELGLSLKF